MKWRKTILITGAMGQLGRALQVQLLDPPQYVNGSWSEDGKQNYLGLYAHHERRWRQNVARALDVTDKAAVMAAVTGGKYKYDAVINCAAWTDTAGCELDPERAMRENAEGARNVAEAAREAGAAMVQVSTNEVFDGEKGSPYDEGAATNAINAYGRSKLAGEEAVRETLPEHYIVRTSWLYGPARQSFPEKILERAKADGKLRLVEDETATPTLTLDLAAAIVELMETKQYGTYHLTNSGECSRLEWAEEIVRVAGLDVPIEATTQAEFGSPVKKPAYSVLENNRAAALGITLRPWQEALREYMGVASKTGASA